jgi:HSP20 family protein
MANIARRSPLASDVTRFDPFFNIDDWFDWVKNTGMRPLSMEMENAPTIKMDLTESDTAYTVKAEIPGVKKEDVKVQIDGNRVSISAETRQEKEQKEGDRVICRECRQGSAYRSFTLSSDVDDTKAEAKYENGTLELTLPKKEGKTAKHIEVK